MESLREIISNLDVYKNKTCDSILFNNYYIQEDSSNKNSAWNNQYISLPVGNKTKTTKVIAKSVRTSVDSKKQYQNKNFLYKEGIDFVAKNKDIIKEKEYKVKEDKLRKENEALKLLLNNRKPNQYNYISSRVYNIKKPSNIKKYKYRSNSSQNAKSKDIKYIGGLYNSADLPRIPSSTHKKENSAILHKDFGKTPEYLERMKEEYKEQKANEKLKEKEKKLPKGTKFLPESERLQRIEELNIEQKELEDELFALPITRLSQKMINRKAEIEKRLYEIETEQRRLSYKNVVVQC